MKLVLTIAYDGRKYHGLIDQPSQNTVFSQIRAALQRMRIPHSLTIECSGRTDKGVSAANMVISLPVEKPGNYDVMFNNVLPDDIRVKRYALVGDDFSARFDCTRRVYRYFFHCEDLNEYERVGNALVNGLRSGEFRIQDFCTKSVERNFNKKMKRQNLDQKDDNNIANITIPAVPGNNTKRIKHEAKNNKNCNEHPKQLLNDRIKIITDEQHVKSNHDATLTNIPKTNQSITLFDQNFYNRDIDYMRFKKLNEIYYMEIASKSFLHNQIRRMFYFIRKNVGKKEIVFYEGLAEPENLIFYQAQYDKEIKWKKSRKDDPFLYEIEKEKHKMIFYE
ncbi:Pseudouridylate synthase [Trachipleistophora hominis]|uniref:Pseudouridylate synthase n=1 Tax=Trachipleistophora hominis TaxID=72359 RepID=L7JQU2_TRAHO|nr:Pseudouridylate synthase [Trachipleistophora hominis]